jgi:hypothetical protein
MSQYSSRSDVNVIDNSCLAKSRLEIRLLNENLRSNKILITAIRELVDKQRHAEMLRTEINNKNEELIRLNQIMAEKQITIESSLINTAILLNQMLENQNNPGVFVGAHEIFMEDEERGQQRRADLNELRTSLKLIYLQDNFGDLDQASREMVEQITHDFIPDHQQENQ